MNKLDIVTYKNVYDLAKKIIKFNQNDKLRKKIAKNGYKKYFRYFNSTIVADFIIQKTTGNLKKTFYWETKLK